MAIKINYAAMAAPLADQLKEQGLPVPANIDQHQADADAVVRLWLRGVLSDKRRGKACCELLIMLAADVNDVKDGVKEEAEASYCGATL